jgi:sortase (surface protein transpeptidase)
MAFGWLLAILVAATALLTLPGIRENLTDPKGIVQVQYRTPSPVKPNMATESSQARTTTYAKRSTPTRIVIPSIAVNAKIMKLGLTKKGELQVPPNAPTAGWYKGSPTPGQIGPSIIVGHVDWNAQKGVFFDLRNLRLGATVKVLRQDGRFQSFMVDRIEKITKKGFPTKRVYGNIPYAGIRLITCSGYDADSNTYQKNTIVYAKAITS